MPLLSDFSLLEIMAASASPMEPNNELDKFSYEIFSILESKFLFGYDETKLFLSGSSAMTPTKSSSRLSISPGKIRILSIDASGDFLLAAAYLARLEFYLRRRSSDHATRISDYFDVAAGSGAGGVLAALLFARGPDGRSLFSAEDALSFLIKSGLLQDVAAGRKRLFGRLFRRGGGGAFRSVFGDATLRDTVKPLLIPSFDLSTSAPFLFSRADAVEAEAYNFQITDVCAATCAGREAVQVSSVDGRTQFAALGGEMAMANPTAAAITHVLHNKKEFPFASGLHDLLVVSIGSVHSDLLCDQSSPSNKEVIRIAGKGMADLVDQAIAMAFGRSKMVNYVRIQANGLISKSKGSKALSGRDAKRMMAMADEMMVERSVESVLFGGKRVSTETNGENLERMAAELIREQERRSKSILPTVVIKQTMTARTSSATTATTTTASTGRRFGSP